MLTIVIHVCGQTPDVKPYGFKLSENLFHAKFRVYKDCDGNGKMKTHRLLGLDAGLEKTSKAVLYLKGDGV
jgi:hypothetical protein